MIISAYAGTGKSTFALQVERAVDLTVMPYSETELQFAQSIRQAVSFVKTHNRPMTNAELRENRESAINLCGEDEEK